MKKKKTTAEESPLFATVYILLTDFDFDLSTPMPYMIAF